MDIEVVFIRTIVYPRMQIHCEDDGLSNSIVAVFVKIVYSLA